MTQITLKPHYQTHKYIFEASMARNLKSISSTNLGVWNPMQFDGLFDGYVWLALMKTVKRHITAL